MKNNKKAISPLIATVLVIGFTIVLAALVVTWGGDLFKKTQEDTASSSELSQICSTKLTNLEVSATGEKGAYTLTLDNRNDVELANLAIRLYDTKGNACKGDITTKDAFPIEGFDFKKLDITATSDDCKAIIKDGVTSIGVFVFVDINGEPKQCSNEFKANIVK